MNKQRDTKKDSNTGNKLVVARGEVGDEMGKVDKNTLILMTTEYHIKLFIYVYTHAHIHIYTYV